MNFVLCFSSISTLVLILIFNVSASSTTPSIPESTRHRPSLSDKLLDQNYSNQSDSTNLSIASEYGEFKLIQSNVLQVKNNKPRSKRDSDPVNNSTIITTTPLPENSTLLLLETRSRDEKKYKHDDKKKKKSKSKKPKKKKGLYHLLKKMKKEIPKFMKKMMPMMKMPSMFMLGMAQANLHNFVMHALMMSKMALSSVIMMIIRELVFGDKDEPVKYYNFGYDAPPRRRIITTIEHPVWKKRRRRHT